MRLCLHCLEIWVIIVQAEIYQHVIFCNSSKCWLLLLCILSKLYLLNEIISCGWYQMPDCIRSTYFLPEIISLIDSPYHLTGYMLTILGGQQISIFSVSFINKIQHHGVFFWTKMSILFGVCHASNWLMQYILM